MLAHGVDDLIQLRVVHLGRGCLNVQFLGHESTVELAELRWLLLRHQAERAFGNPYVNPYYGSYYVPRYYYGYRSPYYW